MTALATTAPDRTAAPSVGFLSLLRAERIKLSSTRSPWWCSAFAVVLVAGLSALAALNWRSDDGPFPVALLGMFATLGMIVTMAMAAVAISSEYRFGTIRTTFQAAPHRTPALLAKTAVVAVLAGIVGLVAAFAAWGVAIVLRPDGDLALTTAANVRGVAGIALVWMLAAVLAVATGILVRHTAGVVSVLLVWTLLVENLVGQIPVVGEAIQAWLPFVNAQNFLGGAEGTGDGATPFGPWGSITYVAALAAGLLAVALVVANRRDA